jgi:hypothetical protein
MEFSAGLILERIMSFINVLWHDYLNIYFVLRGNGSINKRAATEQRPAKTIEELLQAVFSMLSALILYSRSHQEVRLGTNINCAGED